MNLNEVDLLVLSGEKDGARIKRDKIPASDLAECIKKAQVAQLDAVELEIKALCLKAMKLADSFKDIHMRKRVEGVKAERGGRFMCRARMKGELQLEITWNEMMFVGARGARKSIPRQIKKPQGQMRHRKSDFSRCNEWESGAIQYTEDEFEKIRKRLADLNKTRRALKRQ